MSTRTGIRAVLTLAACALLAACATQPQRSAVTATVAPLPKAASSPIALVAASPVVPQSPADMQPWVGIATRDDTGSCTDSKMVRANAAMYTRSPAHFEQLLAERLPLIIYVHEQLQAAGIPGEFAMLPMLESSYDPTAVARGSGAAGLWQFIRTTARRHGLTVDRRYDGRLDPVASTRAAIRMLKALDRQFGDWRLVTMAYNAGPQTIKGLLKVHPDAADKPIATLRVSQATRTHLARLLALNCILSKPKHYDVALPRPTVADRLAAVTVPAGTRLAAAASMAGIPEARLHALNPGYRDGRVPADSPRTLLLPGDAAQTLAATLAVNASESVAQVDTSDRSSDGDASLMPDIPPRATTVDAPSGSAERHRVRPGETLWSIAHHYDVSVRDLERWNDLRDSDIQPGEWLLVGG